MDRPFPTNVRSPRVTIEPAAKESPQPAKADISPDAEVRGLTPKATSAARDCCCATADFNMVDDARKAAIADADNPKTGPVDSISIDPIGEQLTLRWLDR